MVCMWSGPVLFVAVGIGVSRQVQPEAAYAFTKALYENRAEVVKKHPAGRAINPKNIVRDTGTPFHPGAIRYFKEIGIWPDA